VMLMIEPPGCLMCGKAARSTWKVPSRSISTTERKPFGEMPMAGAGKLPAAPETSTSIGPKVSWVLASAASTKVCSRTSAAKPRAWPPSRAALSLATAASTLACERESTATRAPASAKAMAMPRLMPLVPPATNTFLSVKSKLMDRPSHNGAPRSSVS
jgi:hypothetical protein